MSETEQLPVARAREGDSDAWDALFRRFQLPLYTYVHEMVGNEQQALDIIQETFIRAVRHLGALRDDNKFGSWLFGIAHQQCVQEWRRRGKAHVQTEELGEFIPSASEEPDVCLMRAEEESRFLEQLSRLSEEHRSVLVLHFLEDFPLDQIGQILRIPVGTVKSRLHHAKRWLRCLMKE